MKVTVMFLLVFVLFLPYIKADKLGVVYPKQQYTKKYNNTEMLTEEEKRSLLEQIYNKENLKKDEILKRDIKDEIGNFLSNLRFRDGKSYTYVNSCKKISSNRYLCKFGQNDSDGEDEGYFGITYEAMKKDGKVIFIKIKRYLFAE